ncbi:MAG: hemoglobin-like protein [Deltaproteobacteria bacterium]|nr:hemoglobin-like protein [Deltaproteobacteria bacterium]HCH63785.1 hemoglobin-like protein [Deltaproteobacteria bacterium]
MAEAGITAYEALGGDAALRAIVDHFYDLMETQPEFAALYSVHPKPTTKARDRLYAFLSGRLGGPNLYFERHGHPRLRMRHMPFAIGAVERDQWVVCMDRAMHECQVHPELRTMLTDFYTGVAAHMQNRP